jgi:hypothetical protein
LKNFELRLAAGFDTPQAPIIRIRSIKDRAAARASNTESKNPGTKAEVYDF